jgi:hypothetical protein
MLPPLAFLKWAGKKIDQEISQAAAEEIEELRPLEEPEDAFEGSVAVGAASRERYLSPDDVEESLRMVRAAEESLRRARALERIGRYDPEEHLRRIERAEEMSRMSAEEYLKRYDPEEHLRETKRAEEEIKRAEEEIKRLRRRGYR